MAEFPVDFELEERLRDLGRHIAFPPTPALASSVRRTIEQPRRIGKFDRKRSVLYAAAIAVALFIAIAAVPTTRHAVARWFDVPGIHISWSDDQPKIDVQSEIRQGLGDETSLENAQTEAGFPISVPAFSAADSPDQVFFSSISMNGLVSLVYLADDDLSAVEGTEIGLLITQFEGNENTVWANKSLFGGNQWEVVRVDGVEAMWIPDTHVISIQPEGAGEVTAPLTRSTGSVLLWNRDGITYRIEGNLPLEEMIAIAESMEPIEP